MGLIHAIREEAHHLHEIEEEGESAATPLLAMGEVLLVLVPVAAVVLTLAFLAYYVLG